MSHRPVVLMILDGYGLNDNPEANAVAMANTPVMDKLMAECPFQKGYASGMAVGLPDGQIGNSEVGHMNMGAGRIVYQELTRITKEIQDGVFFENPELLAAINNCKIRGSDLHLYGLLSDGGVHSHNTHLYALLEMAKRNGLDRVYVDCFLDGRDTPPRSGIDFLAQLEDKMKEIGVGKIAMISGRYYAMDRDNNYDRVKIAYDALTKGEGLTASSSAEAIQGSYDRDESDEFVKPTVITEDGKPVSLIKDGDSVIFFNFRPDRAREITHCFCDNDFTMFDRGPRKKVFYVCFKDYDPEIPNKEIAFKKVDVTNTFGEWLAAQGMKQARIAVLEKLIGAIESDKYDAIVINFANPDMVGHTGVLPAAIKAVEVVDECVGKAIEAVKKAGGVVFICADHGNCEQMINYETGAPHTAHTTNPVPFILVNYDEDYTLAEGGVLADIVPTLIQVMGKEQPVEMTGKSLLLKK